MNVNVFRDIWSLVMFSSSQIAILRFEKHHSCPYMTKCIHVHMIFYTYYPTALRIVQITPKTSKNITRYLYSRDICFPEDQLDRFSSQRLRIGLKLRKNNLACWIINLYGLVKIRYNS